MDEPDLTNKSDFADEKFSELELDQYGSLLPRLRTFEQASARNARSITHSLQKYETETQHASQRINTLVTSNNNRKLEIQGLRTQLTALDTKVAQHKLENDQLVDNQNTINLEFQLKYTTIENDITDFKRDKLTITNDLSQMTTSVEALAQQITEILVRLDVEEVNNVEVLTADPFASAATSLPKYDGNPQQSFTQWEEKFKDTLGLITTALTEPQKLNRLKFCLAGRARQEFSQLTATTLDGAFTELRTKFQNSSSKTIAKQALSACRQAPGEKVFNFANRLNEAVRAALVGENEDNIQLRLFDEFIDKLLPEIKFHVKSQMPDNYTKSYELAENF